MVPCSRDINVRIRYYTVTKTRPARANTSDNKIISQNNLLGRVLEALSASIVKMINQHATQSVRDHLMNELVQGCLLTFRKDVSQRQSSRLCSYEYLQD